MADNHRRSPPPPPHGPLHQTKVTLAGKNEIYLWENVVPGRFGYTNFWALDPPPSSNTSFTKAQ